MRATPQDSHQCFDAIANDGGVVLFLGRSDVGKSTRIQELVGLVTGCGGNVAVLDADVGQSTYGLPTTLTLVHFSAAAQAPTPAVIARFFVGAISPVGHLLQTLVGCCRLLDRARQLGVRAILIDTTGLVDGQLGVEFKLQKIDLLRPTHVLALAQGAELDPILNACRQRLDVSVSRVAIASAARERSAAERQANRQAKYRAYFAAARRRQFSRAAVAVWGRSPTLARPGLEGQLVGLNDGHGLCLGVGRLQRLTRTEVEVWTPLKSLAAVKLLRFGSVAVDAEGLERLSSPREW
jgi:polynucleotide 5'-hydroxyl-kinase GRC3/NOL9